MRRLPSKQELNVHGYCTECRLPPLSLHVGMASKNYLNEEITPLLPTGIGERYCETISNLGHAALLRRCELPLQLIHYWESYCHWLDGLLHCPHSLYLRVEGYILSAQDEAAGLGEGEGGGAPLQHLCQPRLHLLHLQLKLCLPRPKQEKRWINLLTPDILLLNWCSVSCSCSVSVILLYVTVLQSYSIDEPLKRKRIFFATSIIQRNLLFSQNFRVFPQFLNDIKLSFYAILLIANFAKFRGNLF